MKQKADVFEEGLPFYRIERINLDTGKAFNDGLHILYINGAFRDDSELGKLMHDFSCSDPNLMNFPLLEEMTRYYKETRGGIHVQSF